jgi:DNA repair protein RadC
MKKGIKDLPEFKRSREKLVERGPEPLTDAELLAILLRTGVEGKGALDLAHSILKKTGPGLPRWSVKELAQIPGVGMAKACEIAATFELACRFLQGKRPAISKPEDVLPYVQDLLDPKQEYFVVLTFTRANEVITRKVVTIGLLDLSPSSSTRGFCGGHNGLLS